MQKTRLRSRMDDMGNREPVLDGGRVPRQCPACAGLSELEHLSDGNHEQVESLFEETLHLMLTLKEKLDVAFCLLGAARNEDRILTSELVLAGGERAPVLKEISSRDPATRPAGLTPREVEVLRLVATGLTDAQVAEKLFISLRTVNAHLRAIRAKLGVSSRSAVTRYALEHQLI